MTSQSKNSMDSRCDVSVLRNQFAWLTKKYKTTSKVHWGYYMPSQRHHCSDSDFAFYQMNRNAVMRVAMKFDDQPEKKRSLTINWSTTFKALAKRSNIFVKHLKFACQAKCRTVSSRLKTLLVQHLLLASSKKCLSTSSKHHAKCSYLCFSSNVWSFGRLSDISCQTFPWNSLLL